MKKLILALILLLPTGSFAHNLLWLDADQITSSTITIRQVEGHSELGASGAYFDLGQGSGNTIDIDMQGDNAGCCNYLTGNFAGHSNSSLNVEMNGSGTGNVLQLNYQRTSISNYHHVDVDINSTGSTNKVYIYDHSANDTTGDDHSNTSIEVDIIDSSYNNELWIYQEGQRQTTKVTIDGDSNDVYVWNGGTGTYTQGVTSLADLASTAYTQYIYLTGNSNYVKSKTWNNSNTSIIITGNSNKVTDYNDDDDWMLNKDGIVKIDINGDSNTLGYYQVGWTGNCVDCSYLTVDIDSDGTDIDVKQHGGGNTATIKVYGSSSYSFDLDVHQSQSHTFIMCFNRAHQTSNYNGDFNSQSFHSETWNSSTIYSTGSAADCIP